MRALKMSLYNTLRIMALIIQYVPTSTCLNTMNGSPLRNHFRCIKHQHYRNEPLRPVSITRSRSISEKTEKHTKSEGFSWSLSGSVTGLFEVLEEEEDDDDIGMDGSKSPMSEPNDDIDIQQEEGNEHGVSDAEALLACWSFLKRRKRFGEWNEYDERRAQNAISQNYFLTEDEAADLILDEDDDDDEHEDHDEFEEADIDLNYDYLNDDGGGGSIATVQDILALSTPDDDRHIFNGDGDGEDDVAEDLIIISSFVSDTDGLNSTNGMSIEADSEDINIEQDTETMIQNIMSGVTPVDDEYIFGGGVDDEDDVAKDLITISSFISNTDNLNITGGIGVETISETKDIDQWYTEFTSLPTEATPSRKRRVDAMKRRWEDPAYRKDWHEKRWGSKSSSHGSKEAQLTDRERQAIQGARALPIDFLGSDELASMTEDEIADAIRTRVRSTRQRVESRKETLQRRKDALAMQIQDLEKLAADDDDDSDEDEDTLPREVLFYPTAEMLKEVRQKRSETAKKLYATRLKNQKRDKDDEPTKLSPSASSSSSKTESPTRNKGRYFPPKQLTPQDAFLRIENDLDHGKKPAINDVRLVLEPGRMKNRKLLLRRILQDEFNLRGKCVPPIGTNGMEDTIKDVNDCYEDELEFVTHATIKQLGMFVIHSLKKRDHSIE